jgi:hypothetical protein
MNLKFDRKELEDEAIAISTAHDCSYVMLGKGKSVSTFGEFARINSE